MSVTIHQGDALALLPTLPDQSVDLVIADPPYNSGGRTNAERANQAAVDKYVSGDAAAAQQLADFAGDNRDQRAFVYWLALILSECLRVSRPGASALIFCDWRQLPATSDALQVAGWTWRGIIPWSKPIARPVPNGFRRSCEYVLWASNGQPFRHAEPIYLPGMVQGSQPRGADRVHITQKPVAVLRQLVQICPVGGTVLDPFAGSGAAGIAAVEERRSYIGIELTQHYAELARQRVEAARPPE